MDSNGLSNSGPCTQAWTGPRMMDGHVAALPEAGCSRDLSASSRWPRSQRLLVNFLLAMLFIALNVALVVASGAQIQEAQTDADSAPGWSSDALLRGRGLHESPVLPPHQTASSSNKTDGEEEHEHPQHQQHDVLIVLFIALITGTGVLHLSTVPRLAGLQQSVVLFVLGVIFSLVMEKAHVKDVVGRVGISYDLWMGIDPHLLLFVMLPVLLMGDAMVIDTHVAQRVAGQCLYLAGPGVLFNAIIAALFLQFFLEWESFYLCLVLGSILCATDPVAVVALLKELGASPTLTVQIEGESLLNDGTAIVLFTIADAMFKGKECDKGRECFVDILSQLLKMAGIGWTLGMLVGYLFFLWICAANDKLGHSSSMIQISLTLSCAYVSFMVAEAFHTSGVLSTVAASLMLAHNMWPHVASAETMKHVWHTFEFLGNTVIFFLAGGLVGKAMLKVPPMDYVRLLVIYVVLMIIRALLIFLSRPVLGLLSPDRKAPSMQDCAVMTWGGLRGAVGLALAISVHNDHGEDGMGRHLIDNMKADRLVFFVGGVAFLTTVINATTAPMLVNRLGITAIPYAKRTLLMLLHRTLVRTSKQNLQSEQVAQAMQQLLSNTERLIGEVPVDRSMQAQESCKDNLLSIEKFRQARDTYETLPEERLRLLGEFPEMLSSSSEEKLIERIETADTKKGMAKVVNDTFLMLVFSHYWGRLQSGDLRPGTKEVRILLSSVDMAQGGQRDDLEDLSYIIKQLERYCKRKLSLPDNNPPQDSEEGSRIIDSVYFDVAIGIVIVLNGIFIAVETLFRTHLNHANEANPAWLATEVVFTFVFTCEMLLKIYYLCGRYFCEGWTLFEGMLVVTSLLGIFLDLEGSLWRVSVLME